MRRSNPRLYYLDEDKNSDCVASLWEKFENRRISLIEHYLSSDDELIVTVLLILLSDVLSDGSCSRILFSAMIFFP